MNHTKGRQDNDIANAQTFAREAEDHVTNLISIIEELDSKLDDWVEATGYDDPNVVANEIDTLKARIAELEAARE